MKARCCLFLVLLSACGSSSPSDDGSAGAAPDVSTLEGFIDALCAAEAPCCVEGGYSADPKECVALMRSITEGAMYDAARGKECAAWLREASHDNTICVEGDAGPPSCNAVFGSPSGTGQPGEACSGSADCAPSSEGEVECHYDFAGSGAHLCQVQIQGHVGDAPCLGTHDELGTSNVVFEGGAPGRGYLCDLRDGVYCDGTACAAAGSVGAPCDEVRLCNTSSYCDLGALTCVSRRALGTACDGDGQCVSGAFCNAGTCGALLAAGTPCTDSSHCASDICSAGSCVESDDDAGLDLLCAPK